MLLKGVQESWWLGEGEIFKSPACWCEIGRERRSVVVSVVNLLVWDGIASWLVSAAFG